MPPEPVEPLGERGAIESDPSPVPTRNVTNRNYGIGNRSAEPLRAGSAAVNRFLYFAPLAQRPACTQELYRSYGSIRRAIEPILHEGDALGREAGGGLLRRRRELLCLLRRRVPPLSSRDDV